MNKGDDMATSDARLIQYRDHFRSTASKASKFTGPGQEALVSRQSEFADLMQELIDFRAAKQKVDTKPHTAPLVPTVFK